MALSMGLGHGGDEVVQGGLVGLFITRCRRFCLGACRLLVDFRRRFQISPGDFDLLAL